MISRIFAVCTLPAVAAILFGTPVLADDKTASTDNKPAKTQDGAAPNMDEIMKKWQAYATPGPDHKILDPLVGEWDVQARYWMGGQGGQASESKGSTKVQWILGGRYLREDFSGEMMQMPFQGMGITGYDNFKKQYLSTWVDSMGTGIFTSQGTASEGGKVLTFLGKMDEPATGEKDKPTRYIIRILGPDKHTFEMHDLTLGDKSKVFEMTYTRKN